MSSSNDFADDYVRLLKDYRDLAEGVRMIRRAADKACRAGLLPTMDHSGKTPLEECEAVARAIYLSVMAQDRDPAPPALAGLNPDEPSK
jgi:hypothetical protein